MSGHSDTLVRQRETTGAAVAIANSAKRVALFALEAVGIQMPEVKEAISALPGAVALSGQLVSGKITEFLSERMAQQAGVPELAANPDLLLLVRRAQECGAFARFKNDHWLVRREAGKPFESMSPEQFNEFSKAMQFSKTPVTILTVLPDLPGHKNPSFTMARTVAGRIDEDEGRLGQIEAQIITIDGNPVSFRQRPSDTAPKKAAMAPS